MKYRSIELILILILVGAFATLSKIETASASSTIYIRADGSVDPPTAPIERTGDIYSLSSNIYETIVVEKDNIVIDGNGHLLQGSGSGSGFDLANRNNVTIENSQVASFDYGIRLYESDGSTLTQNSLTDNNWAGILISNSSGNLISKNKVINNIHDGIYLWGEGTHTNTITGNNVSANGGTEGGDGISIGLRASYNTVVDNIVSGNSGAGIALGWEQSTGNVVAGNNITLNVWAGIYTDHSNGNTFYHNNMDNALQIFTVQALNTWDNGYPSGGNYWSDYTDIDLYWGPSQSETGSDGIGDTPRTIDGSNRDNYPLMSPYEYWSNPIPGDINKDMKVDNNDLYQLAIAYGSSLEKPNWNPNSDINSDNIVSVSDLFRLGKNFGKPADNTSPNGKTTASARWK